MRPAVAATCLAVAAIILVPGPRIAVLLGGGHEEVAATHQVEAEGGQRERRSGSEVARGAAEVRFNMGSFPSCGLRFVL